MDEEKNRKSKKRLKIVCLLVLIVILAMILEAGILINVNTRNANKTSLVLLNQAINIIEKNQKNEADMIESLKEDFITVQRLCLISLMPSQKQSTTKRSCRK